MRRIGTVLLTTVVALGCGRAEPLDARRAPIEALAAREAGVKMFETADASASMGEAEPGQSLPDAAALQRKIIYTAEVDLVVEDFDPIPDRVEQLAKRFGGFVANSNVSGSPGYPRDGRWKVRVPVDRYEEFVAAVRELGEVQQVSVDSQDVTEEFYDVEARIRNKKKQEERLLALLDTAAGELKDVLDIERELARVREEIERVEGRLRVLKDLTSLTTVNLRVREVKGYVPEESATYATRVRRGFQASISALSATAQAVSIALVAFLPWLAVLLVLALILRLVWRVARRRHMRTLERRVEVVDESASENAT
jgi:hypothetical protein